MERKNLDMIVLNSLRDKGAGFACDTNKITIYRRDGEVRRFDLKSKKSRGGGHSRRDCLAVGGGGKEKPVIQAIDLSKSYGEQSLFTGLTFTVPLRSRIALIARNGTGKSTLMDILAGVDTPTAVRWYVVTTSP